MYVLLFFLFFFLLFFPLPPHLDIALPVAELQYLERLREREREGGNGRMCCEGGGGERLGKTRTRC